MTGGADFLQLILEVVHPLVTGKCLWGLFRGTWYMLGTVPSGITLMLSRSFCARKIAEVSEAAVDAHANIEGGETKTKLSFRESCNTQSGFLRGSAGARTLQQQ